MDKEDFPKHQQTKLPTTISYQDVEDQGTSSYKQKEHFSSSLGIENGGSDIQLLPNSSPISNEMKTIMFLDPSMPAFFQHQNIDDDNCSKLSNAQTSITIEKLIQIPIKQFGLKTKEDIYIKLRESLTQEDKKQCVDIIRYTKQIELPVTFDVDKENLKIIQLEDTFQYTKAPQNETHFYLNFADLRVFGFYASTLYAQDELQCTEIPLLPHVKEFLQSQQFDKSLRPLTQSQQMPTPLIIMNVPRLGTIDISPDNKFPKGLYGNNFRQLKSDDIDKKLTIFKGEERVFTNIIAMSAIGYQHGVYTKKQVEFMLLTAYKSFLGANEMTSKIPGKKCVIHTGNWGCGAFGNNPQLIAVLQILAAMMAKVDILYYHTFNESGADGFNQGRVILFKMLDSLKNKKNNVFSLEQIINAILKKQFKWGVSDGN